MSKLAIIFSSEDTGLQSKAAQLCGKYDAAAQTYKSFSRFYCHDYLSGGIPAQSQTYLFNTAAYNTLRAAQIKPKVLAGYSLGEVCAISASLNNSLMGLGVINACASLLAEHPGTQLHSAGMWHIAYAIEPIIKHSIPGMVSTHGYDLYSNVSGLMYKKFTYLPDYFRLMMCMPQQWDFLVRNMLADGVDSIICIGSVPGLDKCGIQTDTITDADSLQCVLDKYKI